MKELSVLTQCVIYIHFFIVFNIEIIKYKIISRHQKRTIDCITLYLWSFFIYLSPTQLAQG